MFCSVTQDYHVTESVTFEQPLLHCKALSSVYENPFLLFEHHRLGLTHTPLPHCPGDLSLFKSFLSAHLFAVSKNTRKILEAEDTNVL